MLREKSDSEKNSQDKNYKDRFDKLVHNSKRNAKMLIKVAEALLPKLQNKVLHVSKSYLRF